MHIFFHCSKLCRSLSGTVHLLIRTDSRQFPFLARPLCSASNKLPLAIPAAHSKAALALPTVRGPSSLANASRVIGANRTLRDLPAHLELVSSRCHRNASMPAAQSRRALRQLVDAACCVLLAPFELPQAKERSRSSSEFTMNEWTAE